MIKLIINYKNFRLKAKNNKNNRIKLTNLFIHKQILKFLF